MPFQNKLTNKIQHPAIYIALGANQAYKHHSPEESLRLALLQLSQHGVTIHAVSNIWKTPAWPDASDPDFANAVADIRTDLTPVDLMDLLHEIESAMGRVRLERNAPRTMDLDIVDYQGFVRANGPVLPHPRATQRAFVLLPLQDIAPDWRDPVKSDHISDLIKALPDQDIALCERLDQSIWNRS